MNNLLKVFSAVTLAFVVMCATACNSTKETNNNSTILSSQVEASSLDNSSNESPNNPTQYKYNFKDIGKLLANVSGANAFGIKAPSKKKQSLVKMLLMK